jgi:hypothetical protein
MFAVSSDVGSMDFNVVHTVDMVNHLFLKVELNIIDATFAVGSSIAIDRKIYATCCGLFLERDIYLSWFFSGFSKLSIDS